MKDEKKECKHRFVQIGIVDEKGFVKCAECGEFVSGCVDMGIVDMCRLSNNQNIMAKALQDLTKEVQCLRALVMMPPTTISASSEIVSGWTCPLCGANVPFGQDCMNCSGDTINAT